MTSEKKLIQAAWIFAPPAGLHRDCSVVFQDGFILETGPTKGLKQNHPDAHVVDATDSILLPGLINAHTHLELSNCAPAPAGASFADWILSLPKRLGRDRLTPEEIFPAATRAGIAQSLRFGVTTVGDISQHMHFTRPVLAGSSPETARRTVPQVALRGTLPSRDRSDAPIGKTPHRSHAPRALHSRSARLSSMS